LGLPLLTCFRESLGLADTVAGGVDDFSLLIRTLEELEKETTHYIWKIKFSMGNYLNTVVMLTELV